MERTSGRTHRIYIYIYTHRVPLPPAAGQSDRCLTGIWSYAVGCQCQCHDCAPRSHQHTGCDDLRRPSEASLENLGMNSSTTTRTGTTVLATLELLYCKADGEIRVSAKQVRMRERERDMEGGRRERKVSEKIQDGTDLLAFTYPCNNHDYGNSRSRVEPSLEPLKASTVECGAVQFSAVGGCCSRNTRSTRALPCQVSRSDNSCRLIVSKGRPAGVTCLAWPLALSPLCYSRTSFCLRRRCCTMS